MKITLATYNILFGHDERVMTSLRQIKQSARGHARAIVALQEVRSTKKNVNLPVSIQRVFRGFSAAALLFPRPTLNDFGLMTLANLTLIDQAPVLLPELPKHLFRLKSTFLRSTPQQGALITRYRVGNKVLRVTNLHLDEIGGVRHKRRQINHIMRQLKKTHADFDVICGDFNTIGPIRIMRRRVKKQKNVVREVLGPEFKEVFIPSWTSDVQETMSPMIPANRLLHKSMKLVGISFRQKLDWIFVRGLKGANAIVRHDLKGSDHYPIVATLHT